MFDCFKEVLFLNRNINYMFLISILFTVRESLLVNVQNYKMPIFVLYCILKSVENKQRQRG